MEKVDHLIDEDKLDKEEARSFIMFLLIEEQRHVREKTTAYRNSIYSKGDTTMSFLWRLTSLRHQDDVRSINATIEKLIKKFSLPKSVKYENITKGYGEEL